MSECDPNEGRVLFIYRLPSSVDMSLHLGRLDLGGILTFSRQNKFSFTSYNVALGSSIYDNDSYT